ncbi:MAG: LA2681 family HEPN domain-containing protein [Ignavibacteriaceae bacterium]|jgi:hypothetical protein
MSIDINKIFSRIDLQIRNANYDKALEGLRLLKTRVNDCSLQLSELVEIKEGDKRTDSALTLILNYAGFLIDCGYAISDKNLIDEGLKYGKEIFNKINVQHRLYSIYGYNVANGIASLLQINQHSSEQYYWIADNLTEEAKKIYRILLTNVNKNDKFILPIQTNYANLLNGRLGRIIESLHYYNGVLKLEPNFSMALANKGYVQSILASVIDGEAKIILLHEAYCNIKKSFKIGLDVGPQKYFEGIIKNLIIQILPDVETMGEDTSCKSILKDNGDFESYYKRFCISHDLFLNPVSNSHQCEGAIYDPLIIKHMIVQKGEHDKFYKFSSYFNQIKQEYTFARYLTAQSFYQDSSIKFVDEGVILLDTLDYSAYSIYLEQAKTAFRMSYSILDKIAFVVNEYMNLGMKETSVSFRRLSPLNNSKILDKFYPLKNPYIAAILDLATDFENGHFQKISDLRNTFEHRFRNVHIWASPRRITPDDEKYKESDMMTTKEFRELLIELLIVIKSAIFYLALMVDWEEKIKMQRTGEERVFPIHLNEIPDELKGE